MSRSRLRSRTLSAAALVACLAVLAFIQLRDTGLPSAALTANGQPLDIILVTIDSLRADHLGVYGYERPTSPNLDALASTAVVVRDHIAQAPYTKASIASLFTGLFPTSHKTYTMSRAVTETMKGQVEGTLPVTDVVDPQLWTLASALSSAGYDTVALNTNPFLLKEFGFANGFHDYRFMSSGDTLATASDVVARALERLDRRTPGKPLFLWMHVMEPHTPYSAPAAVEKLFPPRRPERMVPEEAVPAWFPRNASRDARVYESMYDAEIRHVDDAMGRLFSGLRERQRWDSTVLVVTSDHGEEFFEHGGFEHNRTLYDEMLRVPLFVRAPGLSPGIREIQTQAVDLAPTLAALAGGAIPKGLAGTNIWNQLRGVENGEVFAFAEKVGELYTLRTKKWKLVSTLQARHELYDLSVDPQERENLSSREPDRTRQMRDRLAAILGGAHQAGLSVRSGVVPIAPRVLRNLKSLGYVQ